MSVDDSPMYGVDSPAMAWTISFVVPPLTVIPSYSNMVKDSKEGIISSVQRAMTNRKSILSVADISSDATDGNIRRFVHQRRGLARLLG